MTVEFYENGSFKVDGEAEEIVEYLTLMRKEQEKAEMEKITFNVLEMINQINKGKIKGKKIDE